MFLLGRGVHVAGMSLWPCGHQGVFNNFPPFLVKMGRFSCLAPIATVATISVAESVLATERNV